MCKIGLIAGVLLPSNVACAQFLISTTHLHAFGGGVHASIVYESKGMSNPGTSGLNVYAPGDSFTIEYDAEKRPLRIASKSDEVIVESCKDDWCKEDPKAFTLVSKKIGGDVFRKTSFACLTGDGVSRMVMRSVYLGEDTHDDHGHGVKHGEIKRSEMHSPSKGVGILMVGTEKDGKFAPATRNTKLKYIDEENHKLTRVIDESRGDSDGKWEVKSDVQTEIKKLGNEMKKIREVQYPDGEALTETWEYYTRGQVMGPDGRRADSTMLKRHKQSNGTEEFHQYTNGGSIEELKYPDQPVQRTTTLWDNDTKTRTIIEERNKEETSRSIIKIEPTRTTTVTRIPGQADETYIEDFYPSGKIFGGKTRRIIQPDGEISTYEYSQLEDASIKLIYESGKGDGERVIHGTRRITIHSERGKLMESKTEVIGNGNAR